MVDWFAIATEKYDSEPELEYNSRRSPVLSTHASVSTSQPLATSIGIQVLREWKGNAADAAIAIAAVLAVTEPCSTGLGGDAFCLYYDAKDKRVSAVNGSGRCVENLNLDILKRDLWDEDTKQISRDKFLTSAHAVTVPGAARAWEDILERHGSGKLTMADLMEPAAKLAEEGFPVAPLTAHSWKYGFEHLIKGRYPISASQTTSSHDVPFSIQGRAPRAGETFRNPDLAKVLRALGQHGATEGFYEGDTGKAIVEAVQRHGGVMNIDDLKNHTRSTFPEPVCVVYRDVKLWQVPPNTQGVAGLVALSAFGSLEDSNDDKGSKVIDEKLCGIKGVNCREDLMDRSSETLHAMIEMMRLGFGDARAHVCDSDFDTNDDCEGDGSGTSSRNSWFLDKKRIAERAARVFDPNRAVVQGIPDPTSCTVSFQVVDEEGNAISMVNSNYMGFGTGIVPNGCGFSLQNRGVGFSLSSSHPNALAPKKRPYHTIIPGMLTHADSDDLYASISNMGGFMQPQGHFQLTVAMVAAGLDPQSAVDLPRFCIADGTHDGKVFIEKGVQSHVIQDLKRMGHDVQSDVSGYSRSVFGKAQIIKRDRESGVLWAGSDGRADGCAMGY